MKPEDIGPILAEARERGMVTLLRLKSVQAFVNTFLGSGRPRNKTARKGKTK